MTGGYQYNYSFPRVSGHPVGLNHCWRFTENCAVSKDKWYWRDRLFVQLTDNFIIFLACPKPQNVSMPEKELAVVRTLWEIPLDGSAVNDEVLLSLFPDTRRPEDIQEHNDDSENKSVESEEGRELQLREILRPFLVHLFHANNYGFQNPLANRVREKVLASPMLSAIYHKENYRWLRNQYELSTTNKEGKENDELGTAFWRRYGVAEREWFAFCSNSAHSHLFGRSGWLDYIETEVRSLCHFRSLPLNRLSSTSPITVPFRQMISFYLYRLRKLSGHSISEKDQQGGPPKNTPSVITELAFVDQMQTEMIHWYLRRYDLNSVFIMLWVKTLCLAGYVFLKLYQRTVNVADDALGWKGFVQLLWSFGLCIGVLECSLRYVQSYFAFQSMFNVISVSRVLSFICISFYAWVTVRAVLWTLSNKKPNISIKTSRYSQFSRFILYRPVMLFCLVVLGFILCTISAGFFGQDKWFNIFCLLAMSFILTSLLCVMMLSVANLTWWLPMGWIFSKQTHVQYPDNQQFLLVVQACLPRLMFGMIGGWIALVWAGQLWRPFILDDLNDFSQIGILMLSLVVVLAMVEINNQISSFRRSLCRSASLTFVTFIFSCIVGTFVFCTFMEDSIYNDELFDPIKIEEFSSSAQSQLQLSPRLIRPMQSKGILDQKYRQLPPNINREAVWLMLTNLYWADSQNPERINNYLSQLSFLSPSKTLSITQLHFLDIHQRSIQPQRFLGLPVQYAYCLETNRKRAKFVYLLPGMILQVSSFAVFIAIALQLIFQDKRITEPI